MTACHPGGGEPQPGTDDEDRLCFNGHPFEPGFDEDDPEHPDDAWCNVCGETQPVRAAGGGDQPDTPCDRCKGTRVVSGFLPDGGEVPCPACTPSPEDSTDG